MRKNHSIAALVAAASLAVAMSPSVAYASSAAATTTDTTQVVMSDAEYQAYKSSTPSQREKMLAANTSSSDTGVGRVTPMSPPEEGIYKKIATFIDKKGTKIPLREGTAASGGFGYAHYASNHNLTSIHPVEKAVSGTPQAQGAHLEYVAQVFNPKTMKISATVRVVAQAATSTDDRKFKTSDGLYIGVITAFCERTTGNVCPAVVNTV